MASLPFRRAHTGWGRLWRTPRVALAMACTVLIGASVARAGVAFTRTAATADTGWDMSMITLEFPYSNSGDRSVTLQSASAGCGCLRVTKADTGVKLAPGGNGRLVVEVNGRTLLASAKKSLWAQFSDGTRQELVVEVILREAVVVEGGPLDWPEGGGGAEKAIELRAPGGPPIHLGQILCTLPDITWRIEEIAPGRHIRIHFKAAPSVQPGMAIIQLHTDSPDPRHKIKAVFANIGLEGGKP